MGSRAVGIGTAAIWDRVSPSFTSFLYWFLNEKLLSLCLGSSFCTASVIDCAGDSFTAHLRCIQTLATTYRPMPCIHYCQFRGSMPNFPGGRWGNPSPFPTAESYTLSPSRWSIRMRASVPCPWSMRIIGPSWTCFSRNPWACLRFWMRRVAFPKPQTRRWWVGTFETVGVHTGN